ncbi:MAG: hypothetical protein HN686_08445, partial [Bacteroidetes bacterium]|nr:hypothetical protein [Bacteroidota bacterium]
MASIKIKLYTGKKYKDGRHPIILQVIHNKKRKYITTGYKAKKSEWNFEKDIVGNKHPNSTRLKNRLKSKIVAAEKELLKLEDKGKPYTIDQLMAQISTKDSSGDFIAFTEEKISELKKVGSVGNARVYQTFLGSFKAFTGKTELDIIDIDYSLLVKYEGYLKENDASVNTISNYMRTMRAIYNKAIKEGMAEQELYPFRNYKIKTAKTAKRALSKEDINKIRDVDLSKVSNLIFAHDIFMFSFYCRGMNLVDIVWLQNKQLKNGRLY